MILWSLSDEMWVAIIASCRYENIKMNCANKSYSSVFRKFTHTWHIFFEAGYVEIGCWIPGLQPYDTPLGLQPFFEVKKPVF